MKTCGLSILAVLLTMTLPLAANDTALNEGAYGPQPVGGIDGPESVIRMEREMLHIDFGKEWTEVEARFVFRNTKDTPIVQIVGFPDIGAAQEEAFRRIHANRKGLLPFDVRTHVAGVLEDVRTFVNGAEQKSELRYGLVQKINGIDTPVEKPDKNSLIMAWHALEVSFPPQHDVIIERRYRTKSGAQVWGVHFFEYSTATGGVWQGTIGRLQADITLKDGLTVDDLAWPGAKLPDYQTAARLVTNPERKQWQIPSPTHLRLVWEDFEPRTEENRRQFQVATKAHQKPSGE
jgi:hypothetical protein